jgi:large repetitive protein
MHRFRWALCLLSALTLWGCSSKPASIDISPKKVKIFGLERSARLESRLLNKKGQPVADATPNWSSSNPEVVTAEAGGHLVAKKEGKATITASYEDISAQVPVEVVDVSAIEVSPTVIHIIGPVGTSISLQATVKNSKQAPVAIKPEWESNDRAVATVSAEGVVTSVKPGKAAILAKVGELVGAAEAVVAVRTIARLELRPETALVRIGDSQAFELIAYGPDGLAIAGAAALFESSDPAVATVDPAGKASGITAGTATIRARLAGQMAQATLLVN